MKMFTLRKITRHHIVCVILTTDNQSERFSLGLACHKAVSTQPGVFLEGVIIMARGRLIEMVSLVPHGRLDQERIDLLNR